MFRIKKFALAAVALSALSLSVTGCFGDDSTDNPVTTTGDKTAIADQGGALEAGAQSATLGSFISVRGDALDPKGFILTSGDKSDEDEAALDLVFFAMTNGAKDAAGTPSFVSPNSIKTLLNWSTTNKTIIVKSSKAAADFKTVQDVKDAIGSSSSESAAVSAGAYAVALSNGKYAVLNVSAVVGSGAQATVSFRIIK